MRRGAHYNSVLNRAYQKYGEPTMVVVATCEASRLIWCEQFFIDTMEPAYNISKLAGKVDWNADMAARYKKTIAGEAHQERRRKQALKQYAENNLGRHTWTDVAGIEEKLRLAAGRPETREKHRRDMLGNQHARKLHSPEARAKKSETSKLIWSDPANRKRQSEALKASWARRKAALPLAGHR